MLCLSHVGTLKLVDRVSAGFDSRVYEWSQTFFDALNVRIKYATLHFIRCFI